MNVFRLREEQQANDLIDKITLPLALFGSTAAVRKASVTAGALTSSAIGRLATASAAKSNAILYLPNEKVACVVPGSPFISPSGGSSSSSSR